MHYQIDSLYAEYVMELVSGREEKLFEGRLVELLMGVAAAGRRWFCSAWRKLMGFSLVGEEKSSDCFRILLLFGISRVVILEVEMLGLFREEIMSGSLKCRCSRLKLAWEEEEECLRRLFVALLVVGDITVFSRESLEIS